MTYTRQSIWVDPDWFYRPFCIFYRFFVASYTGYITRYLLQNLTLDVRLPQSLSTSASTTQTSVSTTLHPLSLSLFLDQTEYKNNLEIEKIQLNIKKCGKLWQNANGKFT